MRVLAVIFMPVFLIVVAPLFIVGSIFRLAELVFDKLATLLEAVSWNMALSFEKMIKSIEEYKAEKKDLAKEDMEINVKFGPTEK